MSSKSPRLSVVRVVRVVGVLGALGMIMLSLLGILGALEHEGAGLLSSAVPAVGAPIADRPHDRRGARGVAQGEVSDGATVFDDYPGVTRLDPALLEALRRAATDAAGDRVRFHVNSGWRSPAYQEHLLDEAVATYGSREEAARWVATPATSAHVSGDAVDIGDNDATDWLARHGAVYGLCRVYGNEPWHYELRPDAVDDGCPPVYADPTHDPRMRR